MYLFLRFRVSTLLGFPFAINAINMALMVITMRRTYPCGWCLAKQETGSNAGFWSASPNANNSNNAWNVNFNNGNDNNNNRNNTKRLRLVRGGQ